jgi:predicted transcriptional regulator
MTNATLNELLESATLAISNAGSGDKDSRISALAASRDLQQALKTRDAELVATLRHDDCASWVEIADALGVRTVQPRSVMQQPQARSTDARVAEG